MAQRKVIYDKVQLKEIKFNQVPAKQILNLDLKPLEQLILINFFCNKEGADGYGLSIRSISNSFYREKNRKDVKTAVDNIIKLGYLELKDDNYQVILPNIQKDYLKNITTDRNTTPVSSANTVSNTNTDSVAIIPPVSNPITPLLAELSYPVSNPIIVGDSVANSNYINYTKEEIKTLNQDTKGLVSLDSFLNNEQPKEQPVEIEDKDCIDDITTIIPTTVLAVKTEVKTMPKEIETITPTDNIKFSIFYDDSIEYHYGLSPYHKSNQIKLNKLFQQIIIGNYKLKNIKPQTFEKVIVMITVKKLNIPEDNRNNYTLNYKFNTIDITIDDIIQMIEKMRVNPDEVDEIINMVKS